MRSIGPEAFSPGEVFQEFVWFDVGIYHRQDRSAAQSRNRGAYSEMPSGGSGVTSKAKRNAGKSSPGWSRSPVSWGRR
jgi:hypothetical protein